MIRNTCWALARYGKIWQEALMNTAFIQKYLVYSGKSCTYSLRFGGASQQVFPAPQFPPQMVLALSSNGSRFDNSSRLLRMVFPTSGTKKKYINTMLSHDFNSKFQTISRVIYLPYHPFYANQSPNQKINALKPPTKPQQLVQSAKKCSFSNGCNPENIATVPMVPNKGKDHQGPRSRERGVSKTSLIHPLQKEGKTERKEGIITQKQEQRKKGKTRKKGKKGRTGKKTKERKGTTGKEAKEGWTKDKEKMNERIANYCLGPRGPVAHPPMSSTETNRINWRTQHPLSPNPYLLAIVLFWKMVWQHQTSNNEQITYDNCAIV